MGDRCALRTPRPPEPRNTQRTGPVGRARLDAVDRAIVEALQRNGRESFRHIASEIGVSEATIRARYARLVRREHRPGHRRDQPARPRVRGDGDRRRPYDRRARGVADALAGWEEASYVVVTAGRFDLLVELVCSDRRHLLEITNRIRAVPGVVSTESFVYLELRKQLYDWGTQGVRRRRHAGRPGGRRVSTAETPGRTHAPRGSRAREGPEGRRDRLRLVASSSASRRRRPATASRRRSASSRLPSRSRRRRPCSSPSSRCS